MRINLITEYPSSLWYYIRLLSLFPGNKRIPRSQGFVFSASSIHLSHPSIPSISTYFLSAFGPQDSLFSGLALRLVQALYMSVRPTYSAYPASRVHHSTVNSAPLVLPTLAIKE